MRREVEGEGVNKFSQSSDKLVETLAQWRVIPHCEGVAVPVEFSSILWQR